MKSITIISAAAALFLSMGMAKTPPEKNAPMNNPASLLVDQRSDGPALWKGGQSNSPGETVWVETEEQWKGLWREKLGQEAPAVDFSKYAALAIFLGSRNTGGYGVEFLPPAREGASLVLGWREKKPAPGGFVIQAFTQPYAVQLYLKTDSPVAVRAH